MSGILQGRASTAPQRAGAVELSELDQLLLAIAMCPEGEVMYLHEDHCQLASGVSCDCEPEVYRPPPRGRA